VLLNPDRTIALPKSGQQLFVSDSEPAGRCRLTRRLHWWPWSKGQRKQQAGRQAGLHASIQTSSQLVGHFL
jgi:hypothetical protein